MDTSPLNKGGRSRTQPCLTDLPALMLLVQTNHRGAVDTSKRLKVHAVRHTHIRRLCWKRMTKPKEKAKPSPAPSPAIIRISHVSLVCVHVPFLLETGPALSLTGAVIEFASVKGAGGLGGGGRGFGGHWLKSGSVPPGLWAEPLEWILLISSRALASESRSPPAWCRASHRLRMTPDGLRCLAKYDRFLRRGRTAGEAQESTAAPEPEQECGVSDIDLSNYQTCL